MDIHCNAHSVPMGGSALMPNPFAMRWLGFPSDAWVRQIYELSRNSLALDSGVAPGPVSGHGG